MNLFQIAVKEEMLHPNFKKVLKHKDLQKVINSWAIGFEDRDNKFVKEFQTTFNSSFWELYLHACFSGLGFKMDYTKNTPDFIITTRKNKKELIVEAVTTRNAEIDSPEHDAEMKLDQYIKAEENHTEVHKLVVQVATERILASVSDKYKKYLSSYSKLDYVLHKPFILAVGAYEQPLFLKQGIGAILKVCYGLDKAEYRGARPYFEYTTDIIKRSTGSSIDVGIFNNDKYKFLSGILFSPVASIGKVRALSLNKIKNSYFETYTYNDYDTKGSINRTKSNKYKESLLDGMVFLANPHAVNPVDFEEFDNPDIALVLDNNNSLFKHGHLFSRTFIRTDLINL